MTVLRVEPKRLRYRALIGTGGIGTGSFFALSGGHTLGREESRSGRFLENRDYAKLHIITHYVQTLLGPAFVTLPIGCVGTDEAGRRLRAEMAEAGLDLRYVRSLRDACTMKCICLVYPDGSGGNLTEVDSASARVGVETIRAAAPEFSRFRSAGLALAVPEVPLPARHELLTLATQYGLFRVASFTSDEVHHLDPALYRHVDLLALNRDETAALARMKPDLNPEDLLHGARKSLERIAPGIQLIVTAGMDGSWTWDGHQVTHVAALHMNAVSAAGAGDAFLAGVLAGLAAGLSLPDSQQLGTLAGSFSVTSPHTIHPELDGQSLAVLANEVRASLCEPVKRLLEVARLAPTPVSSEYQQAMQRGGEAMSNTAPDVGAYHPFIQHFADSRPVSLSYLAQRWADRAVWADRGRAKMAELLAYRDDAVPHGAEVLDITKGDGVTRRRIRFHVTADRTTEAILLVPDGLTAPVPAVVALHDHGGFYYFGKEKICTTVNPLGSLRRHIDKAYQGRPYADELARNGFVVLVPDAFYFGSQRLVPESLPPRYSDSLAGIEHGSDEYVTVFNSLALAHEEIVAKTLFDAGTTWPGVLFQGDRAAVDYLVTLPEVDSERIGCIGLSIGGFRSAHLFGMDSRIKAAVVAGWMTSYASLLYDHLRWHTWMIYVPGQLEWLDLPDVATLNAPRPLMVANCTKDELFTLEGMRSAEQKIGEVYRRMNASECFCCRYDDVPHSFGIPAQDAAIAWLKRWLFNAPRQRAASPQLPSHGDLQGGIG